MAERLFPLSTFSPAITLVAGMGANMDEIAARAGIPHGLLADPSALITARQFHELAVLGRVLVDHPGFALMLSDFVRLEMFELLGPLFATAPDIRAYLRDATRFTPLIDPCVDATLEEDGSEARMSCRVARERGIDDRFLHAEAFFVVGHALLRSAFRRDDIGAVRLEFEHDGSAWIDEYRARLGNGVEIVFNAPRNVAVFPRAALDTPNPGHSPSVHAHMQRLALARLAALPAVETTTAAVMRVLERETGNRVLDVDDVARELGMATRTLQRRLADEGTGFQALRDSHRLVLAREMLRDEARDIATIAATLGFSEPASFHRAFKGWCGLTPGEYRARLRGRG